MQGYSALWQPGTDHAAIATEVKVINSLKEKGINKADLTRDEFLKYAWDWKEEYGGRIVKQLKKMGSSADWERERFTMDEGCSEAVKEVFIRLFDKGYIYKGSRIINWCPVCKTSISDAEVEHVEQTGHFWHIKYPIIGEEGRFVEIATTRPETMLGDTAVAVNPDDDMFDFTQGYSGTLKNCYGVWENGYTSTEADPRGIEADGNLDGLYPTHLRQSDFRVENMTIVNNAADKADNVDRMQDVIKIRRGAKAAIVNALVKGTGGSIDLIDMSDSKGAGNADSSVSITNSLNLTGKKLNGTLNTFAEPAGNTGTEASLFTWTGYNFSSL